MRMLDLGWYVCVKYQISDRYFNRKGYELTMFSQWATHASAAILGVCRQFSVRWRHARSDDQERPRTSVTDHAQSGMAE